MKYSILVSLIILIFSACKTKDKKSGQAANPLIEKFKPYLNGVWVPKEYVDDIKKNKSPLKSSDKLTFISEFSINAANIEEDSIHVGAGFGNHEGGDFILYFRSGQTATSLPTNLTGFNNKQNFYELGYSLKGRDTLLAIYNYDQNKKLVEKTDYIRSPKPPSDNDVNGFQYVINQELATGTYTIFDSAGNTANAQLTTDGRIKGFKDFKTYYILTDFVASPENMTDEICFETQTRKQKCYGFKISADTINLFEPATDKQDSLFKPGPTIYKFVRQK
jgi:hypothetical protein